MVEAAPTSDSNLGPGLMAADSLVDRVAKDGCNEEVCLKAPARNTDVVIAADLMIFTKVWLGYVGLAAAIESGKVSLNGPARAISAARRLLALPRRPILKTFRFSAFPATDTLAA